MSEETRRELDRLLNYTKSDVSPIAAAHQHERKVIIDEHVSDQSMREAEVFLSLPKNTFVGKDVHDSLNNRPQVSEEEEETSSMNENLFTVTFPSGNVVSLTLSENSDSVSVVCASNCDVFVLNGTSIGTFFDRLIELAEENHSESSFVICSYANHTSYNASMVDGSVNFSGIGSEDLQIFLRSEDLSTCLFELIGRTV